MSLPPSRAAMIARRVPAGPGAAGAASRRPRAGRPRAPAGIRPTPVTFAAAVGRIHAGALAPAEGAAAGGLGTGPVARHAGTPGRRLRGEAILATAAPTLTTTPTIPFIVRGARFHGGVPMATRVPKTSSAFAVEPRYGPRAVQAVALSIHLAPGRVVGAPSTIPPAVPIFRPVVVTPHLGPGSGEPAIRLGIRAPVAVEVGPVMPPGRPNLSIFGAVDREAPIADTCHVVPRVAPPAAAPSPFVNS